MLLKTGKLFPRFRCPWQPAGTVGREKEEREREGVNLATCVLCSQRLFEFEKTHIVKLKGSRAIPHRIPGLKMSCRTIGKRTRPHHHRDKLTH